MDDLGESQAVHDVCKGVLFVWLNIVHSERWEGAYSFGLTRHIRRRRDAECVWVCSFETVYA